jgi:hypothetical protein
VGRAFPLVRELTLSTVESSAVSLLRRVLYFEAAVWGVTGVALAIFPHIVLETIFNQVAYRDYAFVRILGVEDVAMAMLMVLVAQRARELWWWSWAFFFPTILIAIVAVLNATLSLPRFSSSLMWWLLAGVNAVFAGALLLGLARTGRERPLP